MRSTGYVHVEKMEGTGDMETLIQGADENGRWDNERATMCASQSGENAQWRGRF